jgi:ElaB/YqjD/DUF883 family membrane-anchored ribosome-binding protein
MSDTNSQTAGKKEADGRFNSDVQLLGKYVGRLHNDLAGVARSAGDVAQSGMAVVKEDGKNALAEVAEQRKRATASFRDGIVNHPGRSLGIAAGVGFLIGLVGPAIVRSRRR